ncbi:TPA: voltage-gated ClC-type chloride channel ClcB [Enterobacter hormaechei]|nr:voltage-gated ClC-type chloride channel ClcB [Enterobacter hormaechei]
MQRLHAYPDIRAMFRRLLIATVTGVLAALAVAVFRHSMYLLEWLFLSNESGSLVNAAAALSPWRRALTPALGGLAAGMLLWGWQRMTAQRPHAPTDYMEALETGDGQFDYGASLVKSLASLLVVASGSAIGREGAMILLAALAASFFAQRCTPKSEWKLWIACGAAAGMASAYHAPLAGSLFIAEILFGTLMLASLGPVVIAAVVALLTTRLLSPGANTLYDVHLSEMLTAVDYFLIVGVGLLAGVCGPLLSVIAGVFICKLLAVLASSGSGAPGGVFTPTLFVGMATGMLFAQIFALWFPGSETAILLGLAGMATLLAATTHAPIMSALMVCEMTGQYFLLPGLLVACVVASVLSRTLRHDSIYGQHTAESREIDIVR